MCPTYVLVAHIPAAGLASYQEYETRVLPLLAAHGGVLERRLRSEDGLTEVHLVSFASPDRFVRYRDDPRRLAEAPTLERSGARSELYELHDMGASVAARDGLVRLEGPPDSRLVVRSLNVGDESELLRIQTTPEVARWWGAPGPGFPWDEPECVRLTIEVDGRVAGLLQFWEEGDPEYRHAALDIALDPVLHGRGLGTESLRLLARHLFEWRGHHRLTIDPALDNAAAIRCYEKVGFARVGVMRRAERDVDRPGWHDVLLMELLDNGGQD
jgi:aminoglycoside 6'-N-acetyltransferase